MSLTLGQAPFGAERGSFDFPVPNHVHYWEPWPRRMRAVLAGQTVLDSRRGIAFHESGKLPVHWYPLEDLSEDFLVPEKPDNDGAKRWSISVGKVLAPGAVTAATSYQSDAGGSALDGFVTVDFAAMDCWFEEDEPVYAHVRDSYHRVDVRESSRSVVVRQGEMIIAESTRPKLLFETGLPVCYYLPFADVRLGLFERSDTVSECPYKGDGQHWHLDTDGVRITDAAWSLPHPLPEALGAGEHICFYPDKVHIEVDGERVTT
ncbi:DUF427 domain-containing protein [Arthrobacter sp. H14]|uniref:DUF427 domain-containing protein n=1 Tax=Arthrobacter sp. H14 TaxID=1312959 RepID=UPI00047D391C|nr:DUF427 domain-containing protein [Arthrobacter sp. H14]